MFVKREMHKGSDIQWGKPINLSKDQQELEDKYITIGQGQSRDI